MKTLHLDGFSYVAGKLQIVINVFAMYRLLQKNIRIFVGLGQLQPRVWIIRYVLDYLNKSNVINTVHLVA